jgi:TPR repeat protein
MNYFKGVLLAQREDRWQDALTLVREGATKDCDMCCWLLGECYWYGVWVKHGNPTKAEQWLKKAVCLGNYRAKYLLRDYTDLDGKDILDDYARGLLTPYIHMQRDGVPFILKSAEQGDCFAQCRLGMFGDCGVVPFRLSWYEKSAEQGYFYGQYWLALRLRQGYKFAEAVYWYRKSAEQGYQYAQFELADMLISRNINQTASLYWFTRLSRNYGMRDAATRELANHKAIFDKIRLCQSSCFALITIRRYYKSILSMIPKDVVLLFAKYLWRTREEEVWGKEQEPTTKRIKK